MLTLHDYMPSLNGWKVRVLLGKLGIPYQTKPVAIFTGENRTEQFLAKNPVGAIPVLELEDGRTLAESNAILTYLAEGTPYLPKDPYLRAKVMQWLFFEQYYRARHWDLAFLDLDRSARTQCRGHGRCSSRDWRAGSRRHGTRAEGLRLPGRRETHDRRHRAFCLHASRRGLRLFLQGLSCRRCLARARRDPNRARPPGPSLWE